MGFQISLWKCHKNSLSKRLLEGNAITLWDELSEHKEVSQKSSFQFLTENVSFFTVALSGLPNITLQIPQEQSYWTPYWGESCKSVRWINRTKAVSQKVSFQFLTKAISFFTIALYGLPRSLCKFHKNSLSERLLEGKSGTLWDE